MTSIDYGTNPAAAVGIPGINLNPVTSAMTQLDVPEHPEPRRQQQPAAHHEPERLPDLRQRDVAHGQAHDQGRRQPDAPLARDPQRRHDRRQLRFNNNKTSNCAGQPAGCTVNSAPASTWRASCSATSQTVQDAANLFDAGTYTEKRPEIALYVQDDCRATSKLTLNLGLRWDVYPPWVEVDDRQSNFDDTTGQFVVAVGRRDDRRRQGRPLPADVLEERLRSAASVSLTTSTGDGKTLVRGGFGVFWNFTPGGTSSSKAQNQPFLQSTALNADADALRHRTCCSRTACRRLRASIRTAPPAGNTRSIFDIDFRDALRAAVEPQRAARTRHELHGRGRLRRIAGPADGAQGGHQPGAAGGWRDRRERQPAVHQAGARGSAALSQSQSIGKVDYNGLLLKFQRRFANNFSFLNSYTYGKSMDFASDNEAGIYQHLRPRVQPRARPTTTSGTRSRRAGFTSCRGRTTSCYGGWQLGGILYLRGGLPLTITQTQGVQSTGTGNRPNRICDGKLVESDDRQVVRHVLLRARRRHHRHLRRMRDAASSAAGVVQHRRIADQEHEDRRRRRRRFAARGVQPAQSPAVRATRTRRSTTRPVGTISVDAVEPVVLALWHDRAAGADWD